MRGAIIDIDMRALARSQDRYSRSERGGIMNAVFSEVKDLALEGQIIEFGKLFAKGEDFYIFEPGSVHVDQHKPVGFQISHLASSQVADSEGALDVHIGRDAIRFRLDLNKTKNGAVIGRLCESNSHTAMSIGATLEDTTQEVIAGRKVKIVHKARLDEISLCKDGAAGDQAFAYLVDKTVVPKSLAGSQIMEAQQSLHKINRKVRGLKQRIAAMYDGPHKPLRVWSISIDALNRLQTDEAERLQNSVRNSFFM